MSQYYIRLASNDTLPRMIWSRGKIRVVAESATGNNNQAICHVELNHGPNGLGADAWIEIDAEDHTLLSNILVAIVDASSIEDIILQSA